MDVKYSPHVKEKLEEISNSFSKIKFAKFINSINDLSVNPNKGARVEGMINIPSQYRFLHMQGFYVFYKVGKTAVYVINIYSEREDFMWKLFGISLRTNESIDFWGE